MLLNLILTQLAQVQLQLTLLVDVGCAALVTLLNDRGETVIAPLSIAGLLRRLVRAVDLLRDHLQALLKLALLHLHEVVDVVVARGRKIVFLKQQLLLLLAIRLLLLVAFTIPQLSQQVALNAGLPLFVLIRALRLAVAGRYAPAVLRLREVECGSGRRRVCSDSRRDGITDIAVVVPGCVARHFAILHKDQLALVAALRDIEQAQGQALRGGQMMLLRHLVTFLVAVLIFLATSSVPIWPRLSRRLLGQRGVMRQLGGRIFICSAGR